MQTTKRQRVASRTPVQPALPGVDIPIVRQYTSWLSDNGALHPSLLFGASALGGAGLFAVRDIPPGAELLSIPSKLAITETIASEWWQGLGFDAPSPTDQPGTGVDSAAVLYLFLVVGRFREAADARRPAPHFWRPYLQALPASYSDPAWWSQLLSEKGATLSGHNSMLVYPI